MSPQLTAALPLILGGLLLLAFGLWLVLRATRRAKVIDQDASLKRDVLDEGAARAARNQALIDAPPAAVKPTPAPAPAPAPAPVAEPAAAPVAVPPAPPSAADDLTRIKGLGPKIAGLLGELGVTSFAQIAAWSEADIAAIDAQLGRFSGRIMRDQWVAQAQLLAAGDEAGFAAKFGQNG
jgi:predicted flap endonuclease-1-like 5' DNA nuclease